MAAFKAAAKVALASHASLAGVQVAYGDPGGTGRRERLWLGDTEDGSQEPVALRSGRRRRDEEYVLSIHAEVIGSGKTPEATEARAVALATVVEEIVADSPTLGVPNVLWALVSGQDMATSETTDGPRTVITTRITIRGRLL